MGTSTRKAHQGGFSPSIMGAFVINAHSVIVPAVLYTVYHMYIPKKKERNGTTRKQKKNISRR